jgi:hypothetical protein
VGKLYVGTGGVRAEVDTPFGDDVGRLIDRVIPGAREVLQRNADEVLAEARARWPVDTGASRDGLHGGVQVAPDLSSIRGFVANSVPHAIYVMSWKGGLGGRSAMVELLRKPMNARTSAVVTEVGGAIKRVTDDA